LLKKVRISGGGRCNVTHNCFDVRAFCENYPRGSKELLSCFQRFQAKDTVEWFAKRGVNLVAEEDGRMFPDTNDSETIINCFMNAAHELGVKILTRHSVKKIEVQNTTRANADASKKPTPDFKNEKYTEKRFKIYINEQEALEADAALICTGSSQNGYELAKSLGHTITELAPSLFSFKIVDSLLSELSGLSFLDAEVRLEVEQKKQIFKQRGPLLITHWGLSGPAVLKISAWAAREMMQAEYKAKLYVNWLGCEKLDDVVNLLKKIKEQNLKTQIGNAYPEQLAKRFWQKLILKANLSAEKRWADLSNKEILTLSELLSATPFQILGKNRFKDEFVECGGVSLKEINFKTMESKICPGLFFAGEILDIDGITGGFNFQNAWTGGWIAGQNILTRT
jgi:predicted flavoprotein YhiN